MCACVYVCGVSVCAVNLCLVCVCVCVRLCVRVWCGCLVCVSGVEWCVCVHVCTCVYVCGVLVCLVCGACVGQGVRMWRPQGLWEQEVVVWRGAPGWPGWGLILAPSFPD